jgi:hypothetical protein
MSPRDLGADAGAHGFDPRTSAFRAERECRFQWARRRSADVLRLARSAGGPDVDRILLVIDEAHVLTSAALGEVVRACAARAAGALNVLTVLLVGKTSWSGRWPQPELAALAARTARRGRLTALGDRDVASYIRHRLLSVGAPTNAFTAGAVTAIASLSRGTTTRENPTPARSSTGADQPLTPGRRQTLNEATVLR